jgi:hypothetical protein
MTKDLYQYSLEQLAANKGIWPEVALNCSVSYSWVCKLAESKIPHPSYHRVKRVAEYFESLEAAARLNRRRTDPVPQVP